MATVSHGADAERLRSVGQELTGSAEQLGDVAATGRSMTRVLAEHWSGADLEYFVGQGWPGAEKVVHDGSQLLRAMGESAIRNADQQDDASAGGGAAGGSGPTEGGRPVSGRLPGPNYDGDHPGRDASADEKYGELDDDVEERWEELDEEQRREVLQEIVDEEAERYGIDPPPDITFDENMEPNEYGVWNDLFKRLTINADLVDDDPRMAINTAVHEMRHAGQHHAIREANPVWPWESAEYGEGMDPAEVREWEENFGDYRSPPGWFAEWRGEDYVDQRWDEYWDQPVEVDAREQGKEYVEELTPEEMDRLVDEAVG